MVIFGVGLAVIISKPHFSDRTDFLPLCHLVRDVSDYHYGNCRCVTEEDFNAHLDTMAKNAMEDPCTGTNPRETSVEQMKDLFKASFYGQEALVKG
ncbi:hypothetical protein [Alteribacter salitolerans]|uniref:hypothetical protein n=1 Tax=Alteribacter salitolerans TaxID=2912333 RepID=UPI001F3E9B0F|nr:hypothetical protein [Alteribacter salitolerans]